MKLFMLVLTLANGETYALETGLNEGQCLDLMFEMAPEVENGVIGCEVDYYREGQLV